MTTHGMHKACGKDRDELLTFYDFPAEHWVHLRTDNAAMERLFWSLKHEWPRDDTCADLHAARLSVFQYIDLFYDPNESAKAWVTSAPSSTKPNTPRP